MQVQSDDFRKVLRVFIASPGDLGEERRLFRGIVDEVNQSKANGMGMQLEPLGWEDTLPGSGRPQELINEDVKKCDLMIMLLWKRHHILKRAPSVAGQNGYKPTLRTTRKRYRLFYRQATRMFGSSGFISNLASVNCLHTWIFVFVWSDNSCTVNDPDLARKNLNHWILHEIDMNSTV